MISKPPRPRDDRSHKVSCAKCRFRRSHEVFGFWILVSRSVKAPDAQQRATRNLKLETRIRMEHSRVWALPNGRTLGLAAVLVAMCYAGASQSNGAAYLLCFVLTS